MTNIVLGSVQFGMNYGVNNKTGQVNKKNVFDILDYCLDNNLSEIDTSYLYNESELVLGQYEKIKDFKIISKCPSFDDNIEKYFFESLERLKLKTIYGYLVHHFDFYKKNPKIFNKLQKLKEDGFISKIGFSLYYPNEFEYLINVGIRPDIVQIPYNIFDQRFDYILKDKRYRNISFYIRSVYLQGLFFIRPEHLPVEFKLIKDKIYSLNKIAIDYDKNIFELCLKFVLANENISNVIIGFDSLEQLKEIISLNKDNNLEDKLYNILKLFKEDNENIILPFNWSK